MSTDISRRLFTVDDYHRMGKAGILAEGDRVELIRGEILAMSPIGPPHCASVDRVVHAFFQTISGSAIVRAGGSVRLDQYSEPQPDIALLRPRDDFYASRHAGPRDILLIVEVAESSLEYDRTIKARLYADAGVPEYWIVDIRNDRVLVYSDPAGEAYRTVRECHRREQLALRLLPECRFDVDVLLP
jgi:Uma2 family endonuclease